MLQNIREWFNKSQPNKKYRYNYKDFTKRRLDNHNRLEVYNTTLDQWLLWSLIVDDVEEEWLDLTLLPIDDYPEPTIDVKNFTDKSYEEDSGSGSEVKDFVENHVTDYDTYTSYSTSSSSDTYSNSSISSSYDSGSSSSSGWD